MIDIQDHIRNRGALNLFDGKGIKREPVVNHQKVLIPIEPIYWRGHMVVSRQTVEGILTTVAT